MSETAVADATPTVQTDAPTIPEGTTSPTPDATAAAKAAPADAPVAPVYEFTAPDGVTYDTALIDTVTPLFAKANVAPEVAQEMVSAYAAHVAAQDAAREQAVVQQVAQWEADVKADPELGGAKLAETIATAKRAIHRFGGDEAIAALGALGSNPAVVRLFAKIGAATREDTVIKTSSGGSPATVSPGVALFPTMQKKE